MIKKITFILFVLCLMNCEQQPKQSIETPQEQKTTSKITKAVTVDETDFEPFDEVSKYLSWRFLIGKSDVLKKEKIRELHVVGDNSYRINKQGLITAQYDISNNFSEYTYTKDGLVKTIAHKQHTPAFTYYEKTLYYKKDRTLKKALVVRHNEKTKQKVEKTITDTSKLRNNFDYFKGLVGKEPIKINRKKRILLTYGNDLPFCCGEMMPGKNSLHYYYRENQLIDSLVINGLESGKKMIFVYKYND